MKKLLLILMLLSSFLLAEEKKIVGYYPAWAIYRETPFKPQNINPNVVTHINYAFVNVDTSGNLILFDPWADCDYRENWNIEKPFHGNFAELIELKRKNPHLKTFFSVGGWTLSTTFSKMAESPEARRHFVSQCIEFCEKYHFDGIDIDWEYPCMQEHAGRACDTKNFTLLLSELYQAAKSHSPHLLVTIAAPAGPQHYQNIEVSKIHHYLDWINLMTYDFAGAGWTEVTNHHAPLYRTCQGDPLFNCEAAVDYYLSQGVPPEKLILGMPLYGRSFAQVPHHGQGLGGAYKGAGSGTTSEAGMRFFYDIKKNLLSTYQYHWDDQAKAPYLYHREKGEFVTFEDERSLTIKCKYIKHKNLGGAMVWELGMDLLPTWDAMSTISRELRD